MKRIKVYTSLLLLGVFSFAAMYFVAATKREVKKHKEHEVVVLSYTSISVKKFKELLIEKRGLLIDVRTSGELVSGKLKGAINIDVTSKKFDQEIEALDKQIPVFVYSAIGDRGEKAMQKMKLKGFIEVYNLEGGIREWKLVEEEFGM